MKFHRGLTSLKTDSPAWRDPVCGTKEVRPQEQKH